MTTIRRPAPVSGTGRILIHPPMEQFLKELRRWPERLDKEARGQMRNVAAEVRNNARAAALSGRPQSLGRQRRTTKHWRDLVNSIRSGAQGGAAWVSIGSATLPWALTFEFGWNRYHFHKWRGNQYVSFGSEPGYYVYPTAGAAQEDVFEDMLRIRDETARLAFPD